MIGRNAANFGLPGFTPGATSAGSSSTIWPWIIAVNYRLIPWLDPVIYMLLLNACCLLVVLLVLFAEATADRLLPLETCLLAAMPALPGNYVWLISTGMEHLLFITSVFLRLTTGFAAHEPSKRPALLAAIFCGLVILIRPEAVVFVPVFMIVARPLKKAGDLVVFAGLCALALALVALHDLWTSKSLLPTTMNGRRWLYFGEVPSSGHFWPCSSGRHGCCGS